MTRYPICNLARRIAQAARERPGTWVWFDATGAVLAEGRLSDWVAGPRKETYLIATGGRDVTDADVQRLLDAMSELLAHRPATLPLDVLVRAGDVAEAWAKEDRAGVDRTPAAELLAQWAQQAAENADALERTDLTEFERHGFDLDDRLRCALSQLPRGAEPTPGVRALLAQWAQWWAQCNAAQHAQNGDKPR